MTSGAAAADIEALTELGKECLHCTHLRKMEQCNGGLLQPEDVGRQLEATGAYTKGHGAASKKAKEDYQQLENAYKDPVHRKDWPIQLLKRKKSLEEGEQPAEGVQREELVQRLGP